MFHIENDKIKELLFAGYFGLEKEGLRVTLSGNMSGTKHPFNHPKIGRDFCENQTEIITAVYPSAEEAVGELYDLTAEIENVLADLPQQELLWPFSNPPYILRESDIPVARFDGEDAYKTDYRNHLSERYGRYKMTLCGVHMNYSFADALLQADYALSGETDFVKYKNDLYLHLARGMMEYGWILTAVSAASPLFDGSYMGKGEPGESVFDETASPRCSEYGYWNQFSPVFRFEDIKSYADSIRRYVDEGKILAARELYYPIRLKPKGDYDIERLSREGVDHIELRMFDVNPLKDCGVEIMDIRFAALLLIYIACIKAEPITEADQERAIRNFKSAALYDLQSAKIVSHKGEESSASDAGKRVIRMMRDFYKDLSEEADSILDFQERKFTDPQYRYARIIREKYAHGYVEEGLERAKQLQEKLIRK